MKILKAIIAPFFLPLFILIHIHPRKKIILFEVEKWRNEVLQFRGNIYLDSVRLFLNEDFRTLLYFRLGGIGKLFCYLLPPRKPFEIFTKQEDVGVGMILRHPVSTRIYAKSIGVNFQIWQLSIVGKDRPNGGLPIIKDNVKVFAGAFVFGNVTIGNNVTIGAGTIVTKDVPDNCVVVGNPAYIVKMNGVKINLKL